MLELRNNCRMPGSMLILTRVGIIFVIILHRATATFFTTKVLTQLYMYAFNLLFASNLKISTQWSSQQCY